MYAWFHVIVIAQSPATMIWNLSKNLVITRYVARLRSNIPVFRCCRLCSSTDAPLMLRRDSGKEQSRKRSFLSFVFPMMITDPLSE